MHYDPVNWYWKIPGITDHVFSSAAADMVLSIDSTYVAWLASGNIPSSIGVTAGLSTAEAFSELYDVLVAQAPGVAAAVGAAWQTAGYLSRSQEFAALVAAGVAITSTGTPTLSGTYAIDAISQGRIQALALYIQVHSAFPNAASTLLYPDITGTPHTFSTTASFLNFATATGDFFTALVEADLMSSAWPSNAKTIA